MSDLDIGTLVATLRAEDSDLVSKLQTSDQRMTAFDGSQGVATLLADMSQLQGNVDAGMTAVRQIDGATGTAIITGDGGQLQSVVSEAASAVHGIDGQTAEATVTADASEVERSTKEAGGALGEFSGGEYVAKLTGDDSGLMETLQKVAGKIKGGGLTGIAGGAGLAIGAAVGASLLAGLDVEPARNRIAAQLHLTDAQRQSINASADNLYANNFADSVEGANEVLTSVVGAFDQMRDASVADLTAIGTKASAVADLTGVEVGRVAQVAGQLVKDGLAKDATEAFDLLTAASQNTSVEMQGDLFDVASEYSKHFAAIGISGTEALQLISSASADGAIGMDKVGDAVKELSIRATDMSTASVAAYQTAGLNADDMAAKILAGGSTAREGLDQIVNGLLGIEDPTARANAAIGLFGTPIEDLGTAKIPAFLESLHGMGAGLGDVGGRADEVATMLGGSTKQSFETFFKGIMSIGQGIGENLLPLLDPVKTVLTGIATAAGWLGDALGFLGPDGVKAALGIGALVLGGVKLLTFLRAAPAVARTAGASIKAALGPIGLILTGVTLAMSLFSGGNADAEAAVEAHKQAVDKLSGSLDKASGKFTQASRDMITADFTAVRDQFDQIGVAAGDVAAAAGRFQEDGGKSLQAYREQIAKTAVESGRLGSISTEAAGYIDTLARTTGKSGEQIAQALLAGGPAADELKQKIMEVYTVDDAGAAEKINAVRAEFEKTTPALAAVRTKQDELRDATQQGADAVATQTEQQSAATVVIDEATAAAERHRSAIQDAAGAQQTAAESAAQDAEIKQRGADAQQEWNDRVADAEAAASAAEEALTPFAQASKDSADAQSSLAEEANRVSDALDRQNGILPGVDQANADAAESTDRLASAFKVGEEGAITLGAGILDATGKIQTGTAAGRDFRTQTLSVREAMVAQATAAYDTAVANGNLAGASAAAGAASKGTYDDFIRTATAILGSETAARRAAAAYGLVPSQVATTIDADNTQALAKAGQAKAAADALTYTRTIPITGDISGLLAQISAANQRLQSAGQTVANIRGVQVYRAGGGEVNGPGPKGVDSVMGMLAPGEHVWTDREVDAVGGQGAMYRLRAAAMAGNVPKFAVGGEVALNLSGRTSARRLGARESLTYDGLGVLIDQFKDMRKDVSSAMGDYRKSRQDYQKARAERDQTRAQRSADVARARTPADRQRALVAEAKANQAAVAKVAATERQYKADVRAVKAAQALASERADDMKATTKARAMLVQLAREGDRATANLEKARDRLSTLRDQLAGTRSDKADLRAGLRSSIAGFDGGILGHTDQRTSAADIIRGLSFNNKQISGFSQDLARLRRLGLSPALLEQLASAGVENGSGTAGALARASRSQLAQINKLSGQSLSLADPGANAVAGAKFDKTIKDQTTAVIRQAKETARQTNVLNAIHASQQRIAASTQLVFNRLNGVGVHELQVLLRKEGARR